MLVPSENAACEEGVLFDPESEENLVSHQPIQFEDTDGCPVPEPIEERVDEPTEPTEPESGESGESDDSSTVMPY
ncbi:MAG: hypothetical protein HZB87_00210 [Desulfatitalea sp.]|nr:hypothetical protein [Desulfatitalea sp.]